MQKGKMSDKCEGDRNDGNEHGGAGSTESKHLGRKHTRYSTAQVEMMEEMFKECPHPQEKERQELSMKLGLTPQQIKFWFQNRHTQVKVQQERTDNARLRTENERLRLDKEALHYKNRRLTIENALLKAEIDKLSEVASNCIGRPIPLLEARGEQSQFISSLHHGTGSSGQNQITWPSPTFVSIDKISGVASNCIGRPIPLLEARGEQSQFISSLHHGTGSSGQNQITWPSPTFVSIDKSSADAAIKATEEFFWMFQKGEPVWVRKLSANGTMKILNADEFCRSFPLAMGLSSNMNREGSRDSSVVSITGAALVDVFMDAKKWMEMFPLIVTRAQTLQVVSPAFDGYRNGLLQQMYAELQVLSPFFPTRKICFLRFSQQLSNGLWVVIDFSPESLSYNASAYDGWYRKHPSGCVIQEEPNGCSRITWIEQGEAEDRMVHEQLIDSGMTFGAQRWLACLERQCAWFKALVDLASQGASTVLRQRNQINMIRLAQNITSNFFASISALSATSQSSIGHIKITTRKASEVGLSSGVVVYVGTSVNLSVSPKELFNFLGNEQTRSKYNILSCGEWEELLSIANGFGPANSISLFKVSNESKTETMLKQSWTDASGSVVVYAAINVDALNSEDASSLPVAAPYGFTVLPYDTTPVGDSLLPTSILRKPALTSSRYTQGSLLTLVFQATETQVCSSGLSAEYVASIHDVINTNIKRIKTVCGCEDD